MEARGAAFEIRFGPVTAVDVKEARLARHHPGREHAATLRRCTSRPLTLILHHAHAEPTTRPTPRAYGACPQPFPPCPDTPILTTSTRRGQVDGRGAPGAGFSDEEDPPALRHRTSDLPKPCHGRSRASLWLPSGSRRSAESRGVAPRIGLFWPIWPLGQSRSRVWSSPMLKLSLVSVGGLVGMVPKAGRPAAWPASCRESRSKRAIYASTRVKSLLPP